MHFNYKRLFYTFLSHKPTVPDKNLKKVLFLSIKVAFDLLCIEFVINLQTLTFGYDSSTNELIKINIRAKNS